MIEADLSELGFTENNIVEGIVSTYNLDGSPHAAPMGLSLEEGSKLLIRPYKTTRTFANLFHTRCGVVNLTNNSEIFYMTALKGTLPGIIIPPEWFVRAHTVNAPKLRNADASIEVAVFNIKDEASKRVTFQCNIKDVTCKENKVKAYSRANFALIESVIHATRLVFYRTEGRDEEEEMITHLRHYEKIVSSVSPSSRYETMMGNLIRWAERSRKRL